ncbi:hypothetical protein FD00_GL001346 [Liquorilactobacillus mali KCTC 3596 = DSM 20444]|uniref:Uncharacterized protein n=1 Tax=Liquorilactobacillus mali KCTC 3596 = DSM 20444 TaxID=1046596 RepID=A0A0R2E112_9LACO|nr:hypothetical protein FD00_GL001346 [Liquorilactobacillus mali KCTC 3596 = DSM 20444]
MIFTEVFILSTGINIIIPAIMYLGILIKIFLKLIWFFIPHIYLDKKEKKYIYE